MYPYSVMRKANEIILKPVKMTPPEITLEDIREKMKLLRITQEDVNRAVQWARKRKH